MIPLYQLKLETNSRSGYNHEKLIYTDTQSIAPLLRRYLARKPVEHSLVLLLDASRRVIGVTITGIGSPEAVPVSPRSVFAAALLSCASYIILAHNHPMASPNPSDEDRQVYSHFQKAAPILGFQVLDSIIVGERGSIHSLAMDDSRQFMIKMRAEREKFVDKARKRISEGKGTRRDRVLLAAIRLAEVPGMVRVEAVLVLDQVILELTEITDSTARIRRDVRKRAGELLNIARIMLDAMFKGERFNIEALGKALEWNEPEPKPPRAPFFWW